jgi:hypothetical protein
MADRYAALLMAGMAQRIQALQKGNEMRDSLIRDFENRLDTEEGSTKEYMSRVLQFEEECERRKIGCFGCCHLKGDITNPGFYDCEVMDKGMDIHSAFISCDAWEGNK